MNLIANAVAYAILYFVCSLSIYISWNQTMTFRHDVKRHEAGSSGMARTKRHTYSIVPFCGSTCARLPIAISGWRRRRSYIWGFTEKGRIWSSSCPICRFPLINCDVWLALGLTAQEKYIYIYITAHLMYSCKINIIYKKLFGDPASVMILASI
jgi:hypothetical protein